MLSSFFVISAFAKSSVTLSSPAVKLLPLCVSPSGLSGGVWPESELPDTSWDGIPPALSSPSCIVTAVPSISVISPVIVWSE